MATIKFKNVNKVYDNKFHAVHDFNLDVKDKEFIVFVGPSGCGKSTTLRMVAGFEDITSGEIWIDKTCVNKLAPKDRNIAMVFQNYALYPHMTVFENMAFALKLRKVYLPLRTLDSNNPKYIAECEKAIDRSEKQVKAAVAKMKKEKKPKDEIKDFKFRQKNNLISELENISYKYEKPVLTFNSKRVEELEKELADARKALRNETETVDKLTNEYEAAVEELNARKSDLRKNKANLNDVLYDADEYYLNNQYNQKIKKLKNSDDDNAAEKINNVKVKKQKISVEAKQQTEEVNGLVDTQETLKDRIERLEYECEQKKVRLARVNNMISEAYSKPTVLVEEKYLSKNLIKLINKINKLEEDIEKTYNKHSTQAYTYRHYNSKEIASKVYETAKILGLEPYLKRKPAALSGGQRQRVALGRAIVRSPKVFLMDEPLSNLDAKLRVQTRSEISKIHQKVGATTIYVTHDQTEAMTMASRIVIMNEGVVQQIGTPKQVYEQPENIFVAGFIGSPSMNFIKGKISGENFVTSDGKGKLKLSKKQVQAVKKAKVKEVTLGIRPEHIFLFNDKTVSKKSSEFKVNVDIIELLGSEVIVYGNVFGQKILGKLSSKSQIKQGDVIKCIYDVECSHLFDSKTGKAIR